MSARLDADARIDVVDGGVCAISSAGRLLVLADEPDVLFRLAASLMVAADELDTVNASMAQQPVVGVGVPH